MPEPGNPQALNRYCYGLNNPVKYTDPSGHWSIDVHLGWTYVWAEGARRAVLAQGGSPRTRKDAGAISGTIARNDLSVDLDAVSRIARNLRNLEPLMAWEGAPDPNLGGAEPVQYYHYPSLEDAEGRLMAAIEARDPAAFGRALHGYQDYFAHTLTGFSAMEGDITSVFANCPECFESMGFDTIFERSSGKGHAGAAWVDQYDSNDLRAIAMREGTTKYLIMFYLSYYEIGMTYEEFMARTESQQGQEW